MLNNEPDAEWVTYLDSDLFFFASPEPIYAEIEGCRVRHYPAPIYRQEQQAAEVWNLQRRLGRGAERCRKALP